MTAAHDWVTAFLERAEGGLDIDRVIEEAPGLDAEGILAILEDDRLGEHIFEAMTDLMHPTDSMYYDPLFGAFHGQVAVRNWLVPMMSGISFVEFVPTNPTEVFQHDGGTSSIEEWQMWAVVGDDRLPLPHGVSTRHYADGWVTWNADMCDTVPLRRAPSDPASGQPPMPDPPRTDWQTQPMPSPPPSAALQEWLNSSPDDRGPLDHGDIHTIMTTPELGLDAEVVGPLWHPTESRLMEPTAEYAGADAICSHLAERSASRTALTMELVGPALFNGACTTFEWLARPPGDEALPIRGTSVCRYRDGMIVYAADYYDTAALG